MYTIVYIKPTKAQGYLTLGVDALGERIRLTVKEGALSELEIGDTPAKISEDAFRHLKAFSDRYEALRSALSILAYADNSRRQLYMKLKRRGFDDALVRFAISECEHLGYLDEDRQLKNLITSYATYKLYGRERIVKALYAKGYPVSNIGRAITALCEAGEIDFDVLRAKLLSKFGFQDADSEEARALLYRYGYRI